MPNKNFYAFSGKDNKKAHAKSHRALNNAKDAKENTHGHEESKQIPIKHVEKAEIKIKTKRREVNTSTGFVLLAGLIILVAIGELIVGAEEGLQVIASAGTTVLTVSLISLLHAHFRKWENRLILIESNQEKIQKILEQNALEIKQNLETYEELLNKHKETRVVEFQEQLSFANEYYEDTAPVESINSLF